MDWQTSSLPCYSQYCQDSILNLHLCLSSRPTLKSLIMVKMPSKEKCVCVCVSQVTHSFIWVKAHWSIIVGKFDSDQYCRKNCRKTDGCLMPHHGMSSSVLQPNEPWSYCLVFMVNSLVLLALQRRSGSVSCTRTFWAVDRKSRDQPLTFRLVEVPLYHPSQSCSMRLWNLWKKSF